MDVGRQSALGGDDVSSRKPANTDASDRADLQSDPRQRDAESANASRINSRDSEAAKDRSAAAKDSRDSAGAARDQAGSGAGAPMNSPSIDRSTARLILRRVPLASHQAAAALQARPAKAAMAPPASHPIIHASIPPSRGEAIVGPRLRIAPTTKFAAAKSPTHIAISCAIISHGNNSGQLQANET